MGDNGRASAAGVVPPEFRNALARWASGVTVLTARHGDERVGMTAASFSSLSLEPPLILVCIDREAHSHDGLVGAPGFLVHVLGADQADLSERFAHAGPEKFDGVSDEEGAFGAPLLPFGVARLACEHHAALDGGDHTILVGRVVETELAGRDPLLYFGRRYGRFSAAT
jgi:flavin reductase (DIM6/NTAB) family NADH-FMN oxidoreductase RutF